MGGRLSQVLSNLERLSRYKRRNNLMYPKLEVQFLKFSHNQHEAEEVCKIFERFGIDQFTELRGEVSNWVEREPENYIIYGPKKNLLLPRCYWPYTVMLIKYNGDVIPCCHYRAAKQYTNLEDKRIVGNVFETSILEVWNNEKYRQLRQLVSNPEIIKEKSELEQSFCYGCSILFKKELRKK